MPHDQTGVKPRRRPQTELVRGGITRSGFDETSEALFLTSGYIYPSAEEAEAAAVFRVWGGRFPRLCAQAASGNTAREGKSHERAICR